jgi:hypothetical protein
MPIVMKCKICGRLYTSTWMDNICIDCKYRSNKLQKKLNSFVKGQEKLVKKYKCEISIGTPGKMVTIADGRDKK